MPAQDDARLVDEDGGREAEFLDAGFQLYQLLIGVGARVSWPDSEITGPSIDNSANV